MTDEKKREAALWTKQVEAAALAVAEADKRMTRLWPKWKKENAKREKMIAHARRVIREKSS